MTGVKELSEITGKPLSGIARQRTKGMTSLSTIWLCAMTQAQASRRISEKQFAGIKKLPLKATSKRKPEWRSLVITNLEPVG